MIRYFTDKQLNTLERNPEYNERGTECPVCLDTGTYTYLGVDHECPDDEYGHVALRLNKLYYMSFIPIQYQMLLWDEFPHAEAKEDIEDYLKHFRRLRLTGAGFTIWGKGLGVGKTWAATHILRELAKLDYNCHFASFFNVKSYFELDNKDEREFLVRRVREAEILVLDEVKAPISNAQRDFFEDKLEEVLRTRTNMNFPTIITSNMPMADFEREYPRCFSLQAGKNQELELRGEDARKSGLVWDNGQKLALKGETRPIT